MSLISAELRLQLKRNRPELAIQEGAVAACHTVQHLLHTLRQRWGESQTRIPNLFSKCDQKVTAGSQPSLYLLSNMTSGKLKMTTSHLATQLSPILVMTTALMTQSRIITRTTPQTLLLARIATFVLPCQSPLRSKRNGLQYGYVRDAISAAQMTDVEHPRHSVLNMIWTACERFFVLRYLQRAMFFGQPVIQPAGLVNHDNNNPIFPDLLLNAPDQNLSGSCQIFRSCVLVEFTFFMLLRCLYNHQFLCPVFKSDKNGVVYTCLLGPNFLAPPSVLAELQRYWTYTQPTRDTLIIASKQATSLMRNFVLSNAFRAQGIQTSAVVSQTVINAPLTSLYYGLPDRLQVDIVALENTISLLRDVLTPFRSFLGVSSAIIEETVYLFWPHLRLKVMVVELLFDLLHNRKIDKRFYISSSFLYLTTLLVNTHFSYTSTFFKPKIARRLKRWAINSVIHVALNL